MPRGDNAGRPRNGAERMIRTPVTLPPDLRSYAKRAGGGSVSAGVRLALQAHMDAARAGHPAQELQVWRHKPTACYYLAVWRGILSAAVGPLPLTQAQAMASGATPLPAVFDADLTDWLDEAWWRGECEEVGDGQEVTK